MIVTDLPFRGARLGCVDENTLIDLLEGRLPPERLAEVEDHVDGCRECRVFMAETARAMAPEPAVAGGPSASSDVLGRGSSIGRYIILDVVGMGAMGVVYSAYDPELDRKIALKLLRADPALDSASSQGRLLREAQAIARLSHPNVIAIHDAGIAGEQAFVAMEFVEGRTLREWLREEPRSWRAVIQMFLRAGAGLAAAHAAGLVHRDFKPDNVLVGWDGSVRVTDFGLARALDAPAAVAPEEFRSPARGAGETQTGALLGTPAYMAPEQIEGKTADARSDIFSFCVALFEALHGHRPFAGDSLPELLAAIVQGRIREPARARAFPWIRHIVLRGLRAAPEERYPSMDALVEALTSYRSRHWVYRLVAAGVVVLIAALGATYAAGAFESESPCQGGERQLAGIWDAAERETARRSFLATRVPYAEDTWKRVDAALETYRRDWAAMYDQACQDAREGAEASGELIELRGACLDERLKELSALCKLFAAADARTMRGAVQATRALGDLAACADAPSLRAKVKLPRDAALRARVDAVRSEIAAAKEMRDAGQLGPGLSRGLQAVVSARAAGYRPAIAEALLALGRLQEVNGNLKAAYESLTQAAWEAEAGGHDAVVAEAAVRLLYVAGYRHVRRAEVDVWSRLASAALERIGGDRRLEALRLHNVGAAYSEEGKYEQALDVQERALVLWEKRPSPNLRWAARTHSSVGVSLMRLGRYAEAERHFRSSLGLLEDMLGPGHPTLNAPLSNLGILHRWKGRFDEALQYHQRAYALLQAALGREGFEVAIPLHNIAEVHLSQGRYREALSEFMAALATVMRKASTHPYVPRHATGVGEAYLGLGEPARAVVFLEKALAALQSQPSDAAELARTRFALARALWDLRRDRSRARGLAESARDSFAALQAVPIHRRALADVQAWLAAHR
jgi:tetratricopeptide (TPR) repeat protein/tRNA A-37 threonylcarbamoyl transferase component Bud32